MAVTSQFKVLSEGDDYCVNSGKPHLFKPLGTHWTKPGEPVTHRYWTLLCEACGMTVEAVYALDYDPIKSEENG